MSKQPALFRADRPPRLCRCGCGEPIPPRQLELGRPPSGRRADYVSSAHRSRAFRAKHEIEAAKPKRKKHIRDPLDRYYTPARVADACIAALVAYDPTIAKFTERALDPCIGGGAWFYAAQRALPNLRFFDGIDVDRDAPGLKMITSGSRAIAADFLRAGSAKYRERTSAPGLIATNPPNSLAEAFLDRCLRTVQDGGAVAFLVPLAWLQGRERFDTIFQARPPSAVWSIVDRIEFEGPGCADVTTGSRDPYCFAAWCDVWDGVAKGVTGRKTTDLFWLEAR